MRFRCIIWYCPRFLGVIPVQRADYLYITHPCAKYSRPKPLSFDLHVLGTPPAFVLSQDQTLRCSFSNFKFEPWRFVSLLHIRYNCQVTKPCAIDSRHTHTFQRTFAPQLRTWPDDKNAHQIWAFGDFKLKETQRLTSLSHFYGACNIPTPWTNVNSFFHFLSTLLLITFADSSLRWTEAPLKTSVFRMIWAVPTITPASSTNQFDIQNELVYFLMPQ